jgi:hypothetical protein
MHFVSPSFIDWCPFSVFLVRFLGHVTTLNQEHLLGQDLTTLPLGIPASPNFPQTMIPLSRILVTEIIPDTISYHIGLTLALSIVDRPEYRNKPTYLQWRFLIGSHFGFTKFEVCKLV